MRAESCVEWRASAFHGNAHSRPITYNNVYVEGRREGESTSGGGGESKGGDGGDGGGEREGGEGGRPPMEVTKLRPTTSTPRPVMSCGRNNAGQLGIGRPKGSLNVLGGSHGG